MYSVGYIRSLFLFKQKTAYELRISDWSSVVCSSDLAEPRDELAFVTEEQVDVACLHVRDDNPDLPGRQAPLLPCERGLGEGSCEPRGLEELGGLAVGHAQPDPHPRAHRHGSVGRPLAGGVECCKARCGLGVEDPVQSMELSHRVRLSGDHQVLERIAQLLEHVPSVHQFAPVCTEKSNDSKGFSSCLS